MTISADPLTIDLFVPMLDMLAHVLEVGARHAAARGLEVDSLARGRLAPDMYPLAQQIRLACHQALEGVARLTGAEAPVREDIEETFAAMQDRLARTVATLRAVPGGAFAGAEAREVVMPLGEELVLEMKGGQFLRGWSVPQFYFHVVTAYDILRHLGVEIGKRDFMRHIGGSIRPR